MTPRSVVLAGLLISVLLPIGQVPASSTEASSVAPGLAPHVPGEVLVKFTASATARGLRTSAVLRGHTLLAELPEPGLVQLKLSAGEDVASAVAAYQDDPDVEYAQPNYVYQARKPPNDPLYRQMWGLKNTSQTITNANTQPPDPKAPYRTNNPPAPDGTPGKDINVEKAWDTISDCSSVVVAVIDTGVNYNHVDLKANMWDSKLPAIPNSGWNFVGGGEGTNDPMDLDGHGTHVAGTIGAVGNNDLGVTGVCWKAAIMAVKVIGANGADTANIIKGLDFAIKHKAKVINMSLGKHGADPDKAYSDAIGRTQEAKIVVVVAAGNDAGDNDTVLDLPCNFSKTFKNVLCVAGLDQKYDMYSDSNFGKTTVTLGAPATNILSTWAGTSNPYAEFSGEWTYSTTKGGGWGLSTCAATPKPVQCFVDPSSYPTGAYKQDTDDRAYNVIPVPKATSAVLTVRAASNLGPGDLFNVFVKAGPDKTDPFAGGTQVFEEPRSFPISDQGMDVTACQGSNCSIGFQLKSVSAGAAGMGVRIYGVYVSSLVSDNTSYGKSNGTSMASPAVAGVVALVRAYNPLYTWQDTVTAIKESGAPADSLVNKTETGKAVDAMRALAFILPPTGVSAEVK